MDMIDRPQASATPITDLLARSMISEGIDKVLKTIRKHLNMDVAFISHFQEAERIFEHVDADDNPPISVGQRMPLEDGYCLKVIRGELPQLIPNTAYVPAAMAIPATRALPIGSHLSVPIELESGEIYGTLCCFSYVADESLGERDIGMMRAFAELLGARIDEIMVTDRLRDKTVTSIRQAILAGAPRIVYQPIYDLDTEQVAGVECLSRFDIDPHRSPDLWFGGAEEAGIGQELELHAIQKALSDMHALPSTWFVGINSSPDLILSGKLLPLLENLDPQRIVLEITEHANVSDYDAISQVLAPLRARGMRLAIDDAGAGYSSMRHILNLKPDLIKLDMSITRDIDTDPCRRALARGLISFAHDIGSSITAEGVETKGEFDVLQDLGADKVQGFYLSRPLSLSDVQRAGVA
ncbi:sensor domain-containing phosphodiesterase [Pseudomonas sp. LRF_L74]|uniref:sensor domain-containing phosphodiesterase n=1 Tax=Pseudomonas sp. LRF_L74 TaxID=3369422 RepID=UPI003F5DFF8B